MLTNKQTNKHKGLCGISEGTNSVRNCGFRKHGLHLIQFAPIRFLVLKEVNYQGITHERIGLGAQIKTRSNSFKRAKYRRTSLKRIRCCRYSRRLADVQLQYWTRFAPSKSSYNNVGYN